MQPLRALISIGTNSTRLLVVRQVGSELEIVRHESREPRIGDGLLDDGLLSGDAVERTMAVVREYAGLCARLGASIEGIATSALRRADDGERFRELFTDETHGASLRILTGDQEAAYSFKGATYDKRDHPGRLGSLDVGGGSADFACGRYGEVERTTSCEVGAVRLTTAFPALRDAVAAGFVDEAPRAKLVAEARAWAAAHLAPMRDIPPLDELFLIGGTVFTAAAMIYGGERTQMGGRPLDRVQLAALLDRLLNLSLDERRRLPFMIPTRADIMPAGIIAVDEAMASLSVAAGTLSRADLLYGYLLSSE